MQFFCCYFGGVFCLDVFTEDMGVLGDDFCLWCLAFSDYANSSCPTDCDQFFVCASPV